ncbi:Molybdopterin-synthase adenylyltransferase [Pantoea agglomerans]|uniref:Molybdopterin-synthase adenylyltransferase n=1 Tax=Enterobacter agglomerans TaxID=549 RepID=A0A379AIL9_ENTAG|nr:Molybdopterin-synthase adenylyltransferase [Pantoea agglomerans]
MLNRANGSRWNRSTPCWRRKCCPELSDEEMLRYNRQIVLRGFDFDGQERPESESCADSRAWADSAAPLRPIWRLPVSAA